MDNGVRAVLALSGVDHAALRWALGAKAQAEKVLADIVARAVSSLGIQVVPGTQGMNIIDIEQGTVEVTGVRACKAQGGAEEEAGRMLYSDLGPAENTEPE